MKKIMLVFGTRPEAIKMAPLVHEFKKHPHLFETIVCVTGQHREMLDQVLQLFDIIPDFDLNIMQKGQDLFDVSSRILLGMRTILNEVNPDVVLVHGDTTTSVTAALAAFYKQIKVGHVEAGLRTHNLNSPWPEEGNRQLTARVTTYHFAPTNLSAQNLIDEGIRKEDIIITGNTVIDALKEIADRLNHNASLREDVDANLFAAGYDISRVDNSRRMVLITGHRRENFGEGFISICMAIRELCMRFPDVDFVYPMHLNPNVRKPIIEVFGKNKSNLENIFFIEPLEYLSFVRMMSLCSLILTDSGGIQEEAPGLGKPVFVMRDTTERPEAVEAGTVKLVGTKVETIVNAISQALIDSNFYNSMAQAVNPYGDGKACHRIAETLK